MTILFIDDYLSGEQNAQGVHDGIAFSGGSGRLFHAALASQGIGRHDFTTTSVFKIRPVYPSSLSYFTGPKSQAIKNTRQITSGKYIRAEFKTEIEDLFHRISVLQPTLIVTLGEAALWAVLRKVGVVRNRGTVQMSPMGIKTLPTIAPSMVFKQLKYRPVFFADIHKAKYEFKFPEIRRPKRTFWLEPEIGDLTAFKERYLPKGTLVSTDIETRGPIITCIGFSTTTHALVIPFSDARKVSGNYWENPRDELLAWRFIRDILQSYELLGQNFNYDMTYMRGKMGLPCPAATHDTMLLHHALQPELPKKLGFLGSIYTNEPAWKDMRVKGTLKKED